MKDLSFKRFQKFIAIAIVATGLFQGVANAKDLAEEQELKCYAIVKVAMSSWKLQEEKGTLEDNGLIRGLHYEKIHNNVIDLIEAKYIKRLGVSVETVKSAFERNADKEGDAFIRKFPNEIQDKAKAKAIRDYLHNKLTGSKCDILTNVKLVYPK
jgi:hypothetical protein